MDVEVVVGLVVAAIVALYFLFFRKGGEAAKPVQSEEAATTEAAREPAPKQKAAEPKGAPVEEPAQREAPTVSAPESAPAVSEPRVSLTRVRDVDGIRRGLAKARTDEGFFGRLKALFSSKEIDENIAQEIEEVLLSSDVGVATTQLILGRIREGLESGELDNPDKVWQRFREEATQILRVDGNTGAFQLSAKPTVVLMVGVNGAGKTTTIGKLATKLVAEGHKVVLAAGDTFRAAAVQQLVVWGSRVGCEVVRGKDGADPSSVIFDAVKKAMETDADIVLADTAGRLHTKTNLMTQMQKIERSAAKAVDGAPHETLLVLDATNGQNALAQAQEFKDTLNLSGIVLTKLDGTAKGGVILGICETLKLPVRFVGLGERPDDLHEFVPEEFVEALLGREQSA